MEKVKFETIDEYISQFSQGTQEKLELLRKTIQLAAPDCKEVMSYGMPAFKQKGNLVYFAAYKKHIGFYPHGAPIVVFEERLKKYKTSKGAIQFPIEGELDLELIKDIVRFRVQEDLKKKKK